MPPAGAGRPIASSPIPVSSDASALRSVLRTGTRELHERTETAFVLGAADLTRAEYEAVIGHLAIRYAAAEAALAPWTDALAAYGLDLGVRRKAPLLRRDVAALGADLPPAEIAAQSVPTLAHAFGTLYVLEGATLGGQLLRRRVESTLGLTPATGLAFLTAYGPKVGAMWRAFVDSLDRFDAALGAGSRVAAHADALAGAQAAFLAFEQEVVTPTARRPAGALA